MKKTIMRLIGSAESWVEERVSFAMVGVVFAMVSLWVSNNIASEWNETRKIQFPPQQVTKALWLPPGASIVSVNTKPYNLLTTATTVGSNQIISLSATAENSVIFDRSVGDIYFFAKKNGLVYCSMFTAGEEERVRLGDKYSITSADLLQNGTVTVRLKVMPEAFSMNFWFDYLCCAIFLWVWGMLIVAGFCWVLKFILWVVLPDPACS